MNKLIRAAEESVKLYRELDSICVLDLKVVQWEPQTHTDDTDSLTHLSEGLTS